MTHPSVAENPTVHRRQLDFATWPAVFGDIDHLQRAGYDRLGNWDLSQTLEHVGAGLRPPFAARIIGARGSSADSSGR